MINMNNINHYNCFCPEEYARAYVLPQLYENLFSHCEALKKGTIFVDLYSPYHKCRY